jgi:hypothetical protein
MALEVSSAVSLVLQEARQRPNKKAAPRIFFMIFFLVEIKMKISNIGFVGKMITGNNAF